jgi:MFS family permease
MGFVSQRGQTSASAEPSETGEAAALIPKPARREIVGLSILFGTIYFVQGIGDPDDGLISQPVISLLKSWNYSGRQVTLFAALVSLPWSLKPLYGLLTDFVPLAGYRRKSYLILTSSVTIASLGILAVVPLEPGIYFWLLTLLVLPTLGIAFSDVVADAIMVEKGQPRGITGQLQSVQWTALSAAGIVTGSVGGYFSEVRLEQRAFLLCAILTLATLALAVFGVRESPHRMPAKSFGAAARALWHAGRSPTVLGIGGFLFLWNFNPFTSKVLNLHMTRHMGFSEQFYGNTVSYTAMAYVAGSMSYAFYCRRFSMTALLHASIVLGILSTVAYWAMVDQLSAILVSLAFGFTYMTANLIGLDLAARACPPESAGTVFALLMALSNFSQSLSVWLGGEWYDRGIAWWGGQVSFNILVGVGAAFTAGCWLLWPILRRNAAVLSQ